MGEWCNNQKRRSERASTLQTAIEGASKIHPHCRFKDLCYLREENIVDLKNTKFKDLIGGEENA